MAAAMPLGARVTEYPRGALWDALREVPDPELGISLVDMGLVVDVDQRGDTAYLRLTYTAMGCPAMDMIEDDVRARLSQVPGIQRVEIEVVWDPVWTKARLTEEGRDALLAVGIAV
jgi:phenylacetate-CoA oxygenase PaaJ subunit